MLSKVDSLAARATVCEQQPAQVVDLWCATWQAACDHEVHSNCPYPDTAERCGITLPPTPEDPIDDPAEEDAATPAPLDEPKPDSEPARNTPRPKPHPAPPNRSPYTQVPRPGKAHCSRSSASPAPSGPSSAAAKQAPIKPEQTKLTRAN